MKKITIQQFLISNIGYAIDICSNKKSNDNERNKAIEIIEFINKNYNLCIQGNENKINELDKYYKYQIEKDEFGLIKELAYHSSKKLKIDENEAIIFIVPNYLQILINKGEEIEELNKAFKCENNIQCLQKIEELYKELNIEKTNYASLKSIFEIAQDTDASDLENLKYNIEYSDVVDILKNSYNILKEKKEKNKLYKILRSLKRYMQIAVYKRLMETNDFIILLDFKSGYNEECRLIYDKLYTDQRFSEYKFYIAVYDKKDFESIKENRNTFIIKKYAKRAMRMRAKAKYIITDNVNRWMKPKKEQKILLLTEDFEEQSLKRKKYIKKYVNFYKGSGEDCILQNLANTEKQDLENYVNDNLNESLIKNRVIEIKTKMNIPLNKKVLFYKIYIPVENRHIIDKYINKDIISQLYNKLGEEYVVLIYSNLSIKKYLDDEYKGFIYDVSGTYELDNILISDYCISNIFNNVKYFYELKNTGLLLKINKESEIYLDSSQNSISIYGQLELDKIFEYLKYSNGQPNYEKIIDLLKKENIAKFITDEIIEKNSIEPEKHTFAFTIYGKTKKKLKDIKIIICGWFREKGFIFSDNYKELLKYKNMYEGKRCFLVGNGPSLTIEDLEKIKGEITFGCNLIYKIFENTSWRPTYYFLADGLFAKEVGPEIAENVDSTCFFVESAYNKINKYMNNSDIITIKNVSMKGDGFYYKVTSPMKYNFPGGTVMSMMITLAIYMGFKEIYLIGVDCTSSLSNDGHFVKGYMNNNIKKNDLRRVRKRLKDDSLSEEDVAKYYFDRVQIVYKEFYNFLKNKETTIYNATRGGMLEVFERKNLDDVLKVEGGNIDESCVSSTNKNE